MEQSITKFSSVLLLTVFLVAGTEAGEHWGAGSDDNAIPEFHCVIEPSEVVDVGTAVPGIVEFIHAYRSDQVKKGAVIAALEASVERASLELANENAAQNTAITLRQVRS